jgi:exopolysaccharide biosynthesis protein
MNTSWRRARALCLALGLLLCPFPPALADRAVVETDISPLPWDSSGGYQPDPDGFLPDGYTDSSISVRIVQERRWDNSFYTAYVRIQHPSQLRTGLATALGSARNKSSKIAAHHRAVVAINGDFFTDREKGLVIRQGEVLRDTADSHYDLLLIDTLGDFHLVSRDNLEMLDYYLSGALTIQNAFSFGPALVVDGKKQEIPEKYSFAPHYKNPRAAIGQLGELSYVLVVAQGRHKDSQGVTLDQLATYMADIGCIQAFNLDGGNSAILLLGEEIVSGKSQENERSVSDIIYFATSVDALGTGLEPALEGE